MMTHDQVVEALATYALDAVDGEEREEIETHLAECPRCRAELDSWHEVTTALGNSVQPLPEGLWTSIAGRLPKRPDEERPPMPRLFRGNGAEDDDTVTRIGAGSPSRGRLASVAAVVLAAAAVVAVLGVSLVRADNQVSQLQKSALSVTPSVETALATPDHKVIDMEGRGHAELAQFVVADGRGFLSSSKLPVLTAGHTYQLWGIFDGQPISLGLLGRSPSKSTFTLAGSPSASKLAISVEPSGGAVVPSRNMVAQGTV